MIRATRTACVALLVAGLAAPLSGCKEEVKRYRYQADFSRAIVKLLRQRNPAFRVHLAGAIVEASTGFGTQVPMVRQLMGKEIVAVGLSPDAWTLGSDPAAIVVTNHGTKPLAPAIRMTCNLDEAPEPQPMVVYLDDGEKINMLIFQNAAEKSVKLAPVPPGGRRLYAVTTDRAPVAGSPDDQRRLGVRVRLDHQWLIKYMEQPRFPEARQRLLRKVMEQEVQEKEAMVSGLVSALGLGWQGFTEGEDKAGFLLYNPTQSQLVYHLSLDTQAGEKDLPLKVEVKGGGRIRSVPFTEAEEQVIALPAITPGAVELFTLAVDRPYINEDEGRRLLGIQVNVSAGSLLKTVQKSPDRMLWRVVADSLARTRQDAVTRVGTDIHLVGFTADRWTSEGKPGGVIITNRTHRPTRRTLTLGCDADGAYLPITARVSDGRKTLSAYFDRAGKHDLDLPAVPPFSRRMFLVTTDLSWSPSGGSDKRLLGVRFVQARPRAASPVPARK